MWTQVDAQVALFHDCKLERKRDGKEDEKDNLVVFLESEGHGGCGRGQEDVEVGMLPWSLQEMPRAVLSKSADESNRLSHT